MRRRPRSSAPTTRSHRAVRVGRPSRRARRASTRARSSSAWPSSTTCPPGAVDGKDGYRTQQAVIAFQAWEGLGRDGVVGPVTTAALNAGEGAEAERPGAVEADRGLPGQGRRAADRPRQGSPRDSRLHRRARHGDSVRHLQHLPQGAAVLVGSLPGLAALRVLLQQRDRLPRVPRRAHVPRLSRLCPGAGARGARASTSSRSSGRP